VLHSAGFSAMLHMRDVDIHLLGVAEIIKGTARSLSPPKEISGNYANAFRVYVHNERRRTTVRVGNTDPKAAWIEYGTGPRYTRKGAFRGEMPAYYVLTRASESLPRRKAVRR
jgi:hypothetical protein